MLKHMQVRGRLNQVEHDISFDGRRQTVYDELFCSDKAFDR